MPSMQSNGGARQNFVAPWDLMETSNSRSHSSQRLSHHKRNVSKVTKGVSIESNKTIGISSHRD